MAKKATPSGLTISRNKNKFTFKWKRNNSPDAQQLQWRQYYNKKWGAWHSVNIASDKKSAVIALDWANYYPTPKKQYLGIIQFRVRGKKDKKWSAWINKSLTFNVPDAPKVSVSHSTEDSNLTTFSWTTDVSDTNSKLYRNVEWQTCLQSGYNEKSIKATKNWSSITGYDSGTGSANSSKNVYEVSTNIATGSHTRWFRVRARGARGASSWSYSNHVYAAPYQASITSTTATRTGSGYRVTLKWTVNRGNSAYPIDDVTVRYAMVVPDSGMVYPPGASWTDADVSIDVGRTGAATFETDELLDYDEVLFVQVNTKHDNHITYGIPTIVRKGGLLAPSNLSVTTNDETHTALVTATNNSTVPDSYLAVKYCPSSNPEGIVLGIIPHNQTTATVHCPDWSDEEAIAFEVYAVVGEYSAEGSPITEYRIDPDMWSVSISDGGAVPLAPTNVSAYPAQTIGTIQVRWDWAWEEANGAEISWSDHADAWESTDQPSTYDVTNMHSSQWNISELETGQTWYLKVRLFNKNGDDVTYGAYSELLTVDLSSAPLTPVMMLSAGVIPTDGSTTATWAYVSTDGTAQTYAEICEATFEDDEIVYGEIIASTQTAQHIDIYAEDVGWGAGEVHYICLRVQSASGKMSDEWSDPVPVTVAEPLECEITETSLVDQNIEVNPRSFSGDLITFETEMEEVFTKLQVDLDPIQSGSGTPSPSNVRPINGHDDVNVVHIGKNLLPKYAEGTTKTQNGITGTANADGSITYVGTSTGTFWGIGNSDTVLIKAGTYTLSARNNSDIDVNLVNADTGTYIDGVGGSNSKTLTFANDTNVYYYTKIASGKTVNTTATYQLELGTTATDYEPYTAEEIHKDIEVTYTPTVQENEPYQFKRIGDVGGDRESIELVGGSVAWNQMIIGYNLFTPNGASMSISDNVITLTANSTGVANNRLRISNSVNASDPIGGHKYLMCASVKPSVALTSVGIYFGNHMLHTAYALSANVWTDIYAIKTHTNPGGHYYQLDCNGTFAENDTVQIKGYMQFDLTQMFGSTIADYIYTLEQGQAGAGVAFFRKYFPKPYYPYDAGTIKSVEGVSAHKTVGFNQWDEETRNGYYNLTTGAFTPSSSYICNKNMIDVVPNTTYCITAPSGINHPIFFYDYDGNFISRSGTNFAGVQTFTTPSNCYKVAFFMDTPYGTTYNNDICINLSWDGERDGEYEPYVEHSYPLDDSLTLRGIPKVSNGKLYYDGDTYESDGTVTRKYGIVDLGTLTWGYQSGANAYFYANFTSKAVGNNIVCSKYATSDAYSVSNMGDKSIMGGASNTYISVKDSAYTDATTFKSAMSGVYLVYELATPTTETAEPFESIQKVTPNYGTEEFVTTTNVPVGNNTQYYTRGIYGGTLDLVSGVLTVDSAIVDFGDLNWVYYSTNDFFYSVSLKNLAKIPTSTTQTVSGIISSCYDVAKHPSTGNVIQYGAADNTWNTIATGSIAWHLSALTNPLYVYVKDTRFTTASAFKTAVTGQKIVYKLATPQTYQLTPQQIDTLLGVNNVYSDCNMNIRVAEDFRDAKVLDEMPLTVTVSGAGDAGTVNVIVERASDYFLERPDESEFVGYEGETVANVTRTGDGQLDIETSNLLGMLDDGANYRIVATVNDELGQSATDTLDFEVIWNHQALMPSATIALNGDIMEITPIEPETAIAGDTCDIYRLSVDKPQLIVSGASWGTKYVDPYPTIGDFGGYRIVFKSLYGDYITADNILAWTDYGKDENVYYFTPNAIINFDGEQVELKYDLDVSYSWQKDFKETKYLGGAVRGDWNPGVSKTGTVNAISVVATDAETLRAMRRLAEHSGICHVRTPEGSNFAADIQVSVASNVDTGHKIESFTLQITHVDGQGLDGLTYTEWAQGGI